jgi:hypothetical protein
MRTLTAILALLTVCLFPSRAVAGAITLNLDGFVTGQTPTSVGPWLTLTFEDVLGGVQLTVQSGLEVSTEFLDDVVFNIGDGIDPTAVNFALEPSLKVGDFQNPGISKGLNSVDRPPLEDFDFGLLFETSNTGDGALRFNLADRLVYTLTCATCATFDAESFGVVNDGGIWAAAAHFQGIPLGEGSGKFGASVPTSSTITQVPEPASLLLFGSGLALAALRARRGRKGPTTEI